jgi:small subunit ribosomal protein S21
MIRVQVRPSEPLEAALRRFKRQCNFAGIFRLAKKYNYHEKRSDKARRERRERLRTLQRAERRLQGPKMGGRGRRRQRTRVSRVKPGDRSGDDDEKGLPEGLSAVVTTRPPIRPSETVEPKPPTEGGGNQESGAKRPAAEASAD